MANRMDARTMFSEVLLDRIRDDRYPSYTEMAIFEQTAPMEMAPEYLEVLIEKVASQRPSPTMLRHISQLLNSVRA
ncbi:MAG TPA: hypothetical protein VH247_13375 [Thermoleophilaceae bacterium]|nr:hypothetical protein [Thermoleophilaceae bacterium]